MDFAFRLLLTVLLMAPVGIACDLSTEAARFGPALSLPGVLAFVVFLAVLFRSAFGATRPFLPKYDTQIRIAAMHVLVGALLLSATVGSVRVFQSSYSLRLPVGACLGLPLVLVPMAYLAIPLVVRWHFSADTGGQAQQPTLASDILARCRDQGIAPPTLLISQVPFLSPQVLGMATTSYLILPVNYSTFRASLATSLGERTARAIHEFLVSHELAHLRLGDHRYHSWLTAYLWLLLRVWWPIHLVVMLGVFLVPPLLGTKSPAPAVMRGVAALIGAWFPVAWLAIAYVLATAIARDRELLADRRALDTLSSDQRSLLTAPMTPEAADSPTPLSLALGAFVARPPSLFARLLAAAVVRPAVSPTRGTAVMSFAPVPLARRALRHLLRRHDAAEARVRSISSSTDPLLVREGDVENGAYLGALVVLLHLADLPLVAFNLRGHSLWQLVGMLNGVATALLGGMMLFVPLKHSGAVGLTFREFDRLTLRKLGYAGLTASALFLLMYGLPGLILRVAVPYGYFVRQGVLILCTAYIVTQYAVMLRAAAKMGPWPSKTVRWAGHVRVFAALLLAALVACK